MHLLVANSSVKEDESKYSFSSLCCLSVQWDLERFGITVRCVIPWWCFYWKDCCVDYNPSDADSSVLTNTLNISISPPPSLSEIHKHSRFLISEPKWQNPEKQCKAAPDRILHMQMLQLHPLFGCNLPTDATLRIKGQTVPVAPPQMSQYTVTEATNEGFMQCVLTPRR